jgi:hypothetical protein
MPLASLSAAAAAAISMSSTARSVAVTCAARPPMSFSKPSRQQP